MPMDSQGFMWIVDEDQMVDLIGTVEDSPNDLPTMSWNWQPDSSNNPSWFESTVGPTSVVPVSWSDSTKTITISLQIFDDDGETTGTITAYVQVENVLPTITPFEEPLPLWEDQTATFTAEYSDTSSDIESLTACWDLDTSQDSDGVGSADDDCDIIGPTLSHTWVKAETKHVKFHVTDDDGEYTSQDLNFTVRNRDPVADIWGVKPRQNQARCLAFRATSRRIHPTINPL